MPCILGLYFSLKLLFKIFVYFFVCIIISEIALKKTKNKNQGILAENVKGRMKLDF